MDRRADRALSVAEAKALLRATAREAGPAAWVRAHPGRALWIAFALGWLAARDAPRAEAALPALLERLIADGGRG